MPRVQIKRRRAGMAGMAVPKFTLLNSVQLAGIKGPTSGLSVPVVVECEVEMGYSTIQAMFSEPTFRHAVWLFPVAFLLHVFEEWPNFTTSARRYASNLFTPQDYEMIHIAGIIGHSSLRRSFRDFRIASWCFCSSRSLSPLVYSAIL